LVGTGTWIVDCDEDFELTTEVGITSARTDDYGNTIAVSPSPLTKRGTGKMIMSAGNMYGPLTVEGGTLSWNNRQVSTLLNGAQPVTVKNGGRIVGQGYVNSLTMQSGAELIPCASTTSETNPGTIKCENTVTINEGVVVTFLKNSRKNSLITTKNLTMNGTVKVSLDDAYTPKIGDELTLWEVSGTFSGTPTFDLPALPTGMAWDTSKLADGTGILKIVEATGIRNIQTNDSSNGKTYTLDGKTIENPTQKGIYIQGGKKVVIK